MTDYTLVWYPEAVTELRALSTRAATAVLGRVMLLRSDPHPPYAFVVSAEAGIYALRFGTTTVHYDVDNGTACVRILMISRGGVT